MNLLAIYLTLAACLGIAAPKKPPKIVIKPTETIRCRVYGECTGKFYPRSRTIVVAYPYLDTIRHEMVHDLLKQAGEGVDRRHEHWAWEECLCSGFSVIPSVHG